VPPVKRLIDLTAYTTVLPYASELFGVYQPLLGWRSTRIAKRFQAGYKNDRPMILDKLKRQFSDLVEIKYQDGGDLPEIAIRPGALEAGKVRPLDSLVLQEVASRLPPYDRYRPGIWGEVINEDSIQVILDKNVVGTYARLYPELVRADTSRSLATARGAAGAKGGDLGAVAFEHQLRYESSVAGALLWLTQSKGHSALEEIFYTTKDAVDQAQTLVRMLESEDSADAFLGIDNLDPTSREQLRNVYLSPISVVHLFRQYFFELDSFLGTPESHVWLSPGGSVELIEVHTRRTTIEKTLETALETLTRAETTTTLQDEISDAVKDDNQRDVKFGASVKASYSSIEATSSFDYSTSQKQAREATHKRMREQTEKLTSEIRKNFKSTFKTITETTDVSSTKHVLANTTNDLINYELRRKMRQVGVQVQDIGTFLCWQTYVDDPGRELGLAKLIHIPTPPDLDGIPHPEEVPMLQPFQQETYVTIPFISIEDTGADNEDEVYVDGVEVDDSEWFGNLEKIQADFPQEFVCSKSDYELTNVEFDPEGKPVTVSRRGPISNSGGRGSFKLHLDSADFQGQNSLQVKLVLHWSPTSTANDAIKQQNETNLAAFKEREKAAYDKALLENVRDRVDVSSKITTRNSEDLREEERIVVYRALVQAMLLQGVSLPDDRTRHVVAELINAIFDIEKMLYFVAPEWWRPRLHRSRQQLRETPEQPRFPTFPGPMVDAGALSAVRRGLGRRLDYAEANTTPGIVNANTVGWGGVDDVSRDNYFITKDSAPAKLGSSLGWLLQLDGDNMRNAFLNAPWVKAVIPIRPGKEEAAINWLKAVEGMNGITDDVIYHASNPNEKDVNGQPLEGQKLIDVLMDLAEKIRRKYEAGIETGKYPKQDEVSDPQLVDAENSVTATPIDRVYEHGFFPLEGSFRANVGKDYEIFDQWLEILPTDQTVPVEVAYDPKTGRQV